MTPAAVVESQVAGEERWSIQAVEQGKDLLFVLHSLLPKSLTDLTESNSPAA
jgi:hypothetical protein